MKMDLPLQVFANSIDATCICLFRNSNHKGSETPHYHILIPCSDNRYLVVCHITKQIENRIWYYRRSEKIEAIECLVKVNNADFDFLTTDSVIECNQAEIILRGEFDCIIHPSHGCKLIIDNIPIELTEEIKSAINKSPLVKPFIKKIL